jgi:hypothetical protein
MWSERLAREISRHEELFKDFIDVASKAYAKAVMSNEPQFSRAGRPLRHDESRMRVYSSARTVSCADEIMRATIDTYFAPNKTMRELHELMKSGVGIDPLKDFSEAARESCVRSPSSPP